MITKEEYDTIHQYKDEIERIIKNHAYSSLSIAMKEDLYAIAKAHGINECRTCNTGAFNVIQWNYKEMLNYQQWMVSSKVDIKKVKRVKKNG